MAALIKSALIKQLSKFLKNVSANQINISTFKGEGEIKNIQLDENVLMDLIELPTWLRITNVRCNKANLKIQWTKLKTHPIVIMLDKIEIEMEIADPLREYTSSQNNPLAKEPVSAYGFIDRCMDGVQLNIDSITVTIKSKTFNANLSMSNICIYSTTPNWQRAQDITNTKLKDVTKGEIILYKEISWEICRLEAFNFDPTLTATNGSNNQATSIKLIMNPSKIQIALKKKLSDKSIICSTLKVLLNEIYWMANDTQLKSAIGTYNTISKLMKKAFVQKRKYAYYQQTSQQTNKPKTPQQSPQQNLKNFSQNTSNIDASKVFCQYDIIETSLQLHISILNIHLYADDNFSGNKLIDGGAVQVLFNGLCIDHYPYHKTGSSTKHWHNFNHTFKQREEWSKSLINEFTNKLQTILNKSNINDLNRIKLKNSINLLEGCTIFTLKDLCVYKVTTNMSNSRANLTTKSKKFSQNNTSKTNNEPKISYNDFLRTKQFFIEQQLYNKRPFVSSNSLDFNLPNDTLLAHFFHSEFYFPEDCNYPVPCPQIFAQISPILINLDFLTLLWINTLMLSLYREKLIVDQSKKSEKNIQVNPTLSNMDCHNMERPNIHCDTNLELIMPKLSLSIYPNEIGNEKEEPASPSQSNSDMNNDFIKRPSSIEIGFARICITNQNMHTNSLLSNTKNLSSLETSFKKCYETSKNLCNKHSKFDNNSTSLQTNQFNSSELKMNLLAPCFRDLLKNENLPYLRYDLSFDDDLTKLINTTNEATNSRVGLFLKSLNKNVLSKNANKDSWSVEFESMWIDFCGNAYSKSPTNENSSLTQNTSFKIYIVNVWNFYKSTPSTTDDLSCLKNLNIKKDSFDLALKNGICDSIELESLINNSNYFHQENLDRAFSRLANVIKLNDIVKCNIKSKDGENSSQDCHSISNRKIEKHITRPIKRSKSLSLSTNLIKNQQNSHYLCRRIYSKLNVIGYIDELQVTINHSQILFLLRLIDTIELLSNQLKEDADNTLKYQTTVSSKDLNMVKNNNLANDKDREDEKDDDILSANISIVVNKIGIDLSINDHFDKENSSKNKSRLKTDISPKKPDSINYSSPESKSSLNLNLNSTKISKQKDSYDNKSLQSFDHTLPGLVIKDPMAHEIKKDDFDLISKQLDNEFMAGYLKFIYGLSSDNPNLRHCFISMSPNSHADESSNHVLNEKHDVNVSNGSISLTSSMHKSISNNSTSSTATTNNTIPVSNTSKNNTSKKDTSPTQSDIIDADFYDDNYSAIINLEQDDTSSLTSYSSELLNPVYLLDKEIKIKPVQENSSQIQQKHQIIKQRQKSTASISSSSSSSLAVSLQAKHINNNSPISSNNNPITEQIILPKQFSSNGTQTNIPTKTVNIKLSNINLYAQQSDKGLCVLATLDEIEMEKHKSSLSEKTANFSMEPTDSNNKKETFDICICFKIIEKDEESKDGLAELIIENLKFEVDIPIIIGLVELVDDDDFFEPNKKTLPVNILLKNCKFCLNDNPGDFNKPLHIGINKLLVNKLSNNEISISEISCASPFLNKKPFNLKQTIFNKNLKTYWQSNTHHRKSLSKEIEYESQFNLFKQESILSFSYKSIHDSTNSDQFASLIYLLRKSKEENNRLQIELRDERQRQINYEKQISKQVEALELAGKTIQHNIPATTVEEVGTHDFIITEKSELDRDNEVKKKFELERKQFESLLKKYQEENELLKIKLEKSEKNFLVLNNEREILIKKLNSKPK